LYTLCNSFGAIVISHGFDEVGGRVGILALFYDLSLLRLQFRMPLIHPNFDPIAFSIGPISIRWYGLMYLVAFLLFYVLGRWRIAKGKTRLSARDLDDILFLGALGVIIGGRLGSVLFYNLDYYLLHPLDVFMVWKGGMSFHGGFLGVLVAMWWFARSRKYAWLQVTDFIAPLCPTGLAAGRLGNFINGELWGRPTDPSAPWAMVFPQAHDGLARHPSQLYQFGLEGVSFIYSSVVVCCKTPAQRSRQRTIFNRLRFIPIYCGVCSST
jgi:phosphatidylglycerol:prolipoprotein diacylglycerol transferase